MQKYKNLIVLANLGGPRSIDEVKGFLLDLLGDPNVIQLPFFLKPFQQNLANFIVKSRLPKSQKLYTEIGGKSPLVAITQVQANSLQTKLGNSFKVCIFMNCGKLGLDELKTELENIQFEKIIILPLFPQYSTTTTKTSFEKLNTFFASHNPNIPIIQIKSYPAHPKFIQAWVERIKARLHSMSEPKHEVKLLFSAHGIPVDYIKKGDIYLDEIKLSVSKIMEFFPNNTYTLCFQSKFGPNKWLEPATDKVIEHLEPGVQALVIPISFVSDHVETLHEIGIEFKEIAESRGVELCRVPGLNNSDLLIECLADLALEALK